MGPSDLDQSYCRPAVVAAVVAGAPHLWALAVVVAVVAGAPHLWARHQPYRLGVAAPSLMPPRLMPPSCPLQVMVAEDDKCKQMVEERKHKWK